MKAALKAEWQHQNLDRHIVYNRDYRQRVKKAVMDAYGGRCACCGATELVWLTIDHVHDDGATARRALHGGNSTRLYGWLKRSDFPSGYQVLCFNCNWAKGRGGCPHGTPAGQPGGGS